MKCFKHFKVKLNILKQTPTRRILKLRHSTKLAKKIAFNQQTTARAAVCSSNVQNPLDTFSRSCSV